MLQSIIKSNETYNIPYCTIIILIYFSLLLNSIEIISSYKIYKEDGGIYPWSIHRIGFKYSFSNNKILNRIYTATGLVILNCLRILFIILNGFILLKYSSTPSFIVLHFIITIISLLVYYRTLGHLNGADQMNIVICIAFCISMLSNSKSGYELTLIFIALNSIICYFTTGVLKIFERNWWNGIFLFNILKTNSFSNKFIQKALKNHLFASLIKKTSLLFILWEVLFVFTPIFPIKVLIVFLLFGIIFHLAIAVIMGLNTFLWTFIATYAAIIFFNIKIHHLINLN